MNLKHINLFYRMQNVINFIDGKTMKKDIRFSFTLAHVLIKEDINKFENGSHDKKTFKLR